ncbi:MAG: peptide chain release factor N(5)-glutamine methyltransferase, partial [Legionellales bacterium]|nr:peptide chain release factor N(5)-glutamine methyltransferase [Legionellales bacterium]
MVKIRLIEALAIGQEHTLSRYESKLLLAHVLKVKPSWLDTWPENILTQSQQNGFLNLCQRFQAGEPIAYLLGECPFWSLTLRVSPDTLIPRPETEHLVEWVLDHFTDELALTVADLGTGSGAIALALKLERPSWHIIATDSSEAALAIAKSNAQCLERDNPANPRVDWRLGSWFEALQGTQCDIIV